MRRFSRAVDWTVDVGLGWALAGWLLLTWAATVAALFAWAPWWTGVVWFLVGLPFLGTLFVVVSDGR